MVDAYFQHSKAAFVNKVLHHIKIGYITGKLLKKLHRCPIFILPISHGVKPILWEQLMFETVWPPR